MFSSLFTVKFDDAIKLMFSVNSRAKSNTEMKEVSVPDSDYLDLSMHFGKCLAFESPQVLIYLKQEQEPCACN